MARTIYIWVDDVRPAPEGYIWCKSVNQAKQVIRGEELAGTHIALLDVDHDAGDFAFDGGDYIQLLNWLEETERDYPIHIHSMNPVGVQNMRNIIQHNDWEEVR